MVRNFYVGFTSSEVIFLFYIWFSKCADTFLLKERKNGRELVGSVAWLETFILGAGSSVKKRARFRIELARTGRKRS